jgi:hypothetical protein
MSVTLKDSLNNTGMWEKCDSSCYHRTKSSCTIVGYNKEQHIPIRKQEIRTESSGKQILVGESVIAQILIPQRWTRKIGDWPEKLGKRPVSTLAAL